MNSNKIKHIQTALAQLSLSIETIDSVQSSLIDIDLSLDKTRQLYEMLTDFKLEHLSTPTNIQTENIPVPPKENLEDTVDELVSDDINDDIDKEAVKYMNEKEAIEWVPEEKENIESKIDSPKKEEKETLLSTDTIADQFQDKTSLNDILSNIADDNDLATQLQQQPIKDLKNAISLNDKIWFTRELFGSDNDKYIDTLERINNAESIQVAIDIVDQFAWNKEDSSTKRFLELIYRRFV